MSGNRVFSTYGTYGDSGVCGDFTSFRTPLPAKARPPCVKRTIVLTKNIKNNEQIRSEYIICAFGATLKKGKQK